jgi:hypothetical protein
LTTASMVSDIRFLSKTTDEGQTSYFSKSDADSSVAI